MWPVLKYSLALYIPGDFVLSMSEGIVARYVKAVMYDMIQNHPMKINVCVRHAN
jgi:hypothetical protein